MPRAPTTRRLIIEAYCRRPRGAALTRDQLAVATHRAHTTVAHVTDSLISAGLIENTSPPGHIAKYRLTPAGRHHLLGEALARAEAESSEAEPSESQEDPEKPAAAPQPVAPGRTWHAGATAPAAAGDLNPWAGVPLRAGALDAAALPSRGIKA